MGSSRSFVKREYLILYSIFISGFVFYLSILTRDPLIYGIDGPYYLIQVRSLLENGRLEYGDPPLAFFIFTFFTLLSGGDITFGVRIGVALFSALAAIPIYFWIKKITSSTISGYVGMLACIFSAPHIRLMNDLLKNAVGAFFLLCFIYYLHSLAVDKEKRQNLLFATVFLLLTGATHILDFGVALLFMTLYPIMAIVVGPDIKVKSYVKNVGLLLLMVLIFGLAALSAFPSLFTDFFKGFAFLHDLFWEMGEGPSIRFLFNPMSGVFILPILTTGIILSFFEWRMGRREEGFAISTVTAVGLLLSLPLIPNEWLWRFLLMEFIPTSFILGYSVSKMKQKINIAILLLLSLLPLVLQGVATSGNMAPTIRELDYRELESMNGVLPPNSVIIAEFRIGYWVQYITRSDISKRPSPQLRQNFDHVLLLIDKFSPRKPHVPLKSTKLFEGNRFILYELP